METLKTSREIAASPEKVFSAFIDSSRLAKWWGPEGFTNTFEICEIKTGGKWKFIMHGPDGRDYPNESEFGEIILNKKFVVKHIAEPIFTATFSLRPIENGTLLEWVSEFENEDFVNSARDFLTTANEQNLDRLVDEILDFDK